MLLGATIFLRPGLAADSDPPPQQQLIKTVGYSSGQTGHKLTWLPYRPASLGADSQVVRTQGLAPAGTTDQSSGSAGVAGVEPIARLVPDAPAKAAESAAAPSATSDPFRNPFSDPPAGAKTDDKAGKGTEKKEATKAEPPPARASEPLSDKLLEKPAPELMPGNLVPPLPRDEAAPRGKSAKELQEKPMPGLESQLAAKPPEKETCPTYEELKLKRINEITNDISAKGDKFPFECPLKSEEYKPRPQLGITYTWKASALCHKPLYFEEVALERYGHSVGPYLQPVASAAHFFLIVPALPYFMGVYPPNECIYTLGYYRPGSCAPYILDPFPISVRGGLAEAAVWTGMVFLIP